MNQPLQERLYQLLPGLYQSYDTLQGEPLRALLALLEQELQILENDTDRLYDNWFIETCEDWVVPYIGDLLDAQTLYSRSLRGGQERRAFIANTLAYRRRKGTAIVLEQLALDVSGWPGRAVEYLNLLAHTPNLTIAGERAVGTVDLRQGQHLERLGSPFEQGAFTAEVRSSRSGGQYNLTRVGLFLWRLQSYPLSRVSARAVPLASGKWQGHCYTFNPLGYDRVPLFNQPQTKTSNTEPTTAIHVPAILSRAMLANEIKRRRGQRASGQPSDPKGYLGLNPVLQIFVDGQTDALLPEQMLILDLSDWDTSGWQLPNGQADATLPTVRYEVAIDPELGRLVFLHRPLPRRVEVSYAYGFSGDIGGGPYDRPRLPAASRQVVWQVQQEPPFDQNPLQQAIDQWHQTTADWQACRDRTSLPLAKLRVPELPWIDLEREVRQDFQPGIVRGLEVMVTPGASAAIVRPGLAIDAQGRLIKLTQSYSLSLEAYKGQTLAIVASYRSAPLMTEEEEAEESPVEVPPPIEVVPAEQAKQYSSRTYLRLGLLAVNSRGQLISQSSHARPGFRPGIIRGLAVRLDVVRGELILKPGLAVNRKGQLIRLETADRVALEPKRQQAMLLVLSRRMELGKPDQCERRGQQWQLDLIAEDADVDREHPPDRFLRLVRVPKASRKLESVSVELAESVGRPAAAIELRPTFQPGIVWGLTVIAHPGQNRAIVTPGVAVGEQGQLISVPENQRISLRGYPRQQVGIYLVYQVELPRPSWAIQVSGDRPQGLALLLTRVSLDGQGRLTDLPHHARRRTFRPGLLQSSMLMVAPSAEGAFPQVTVTTGTAIDAEGRLLSLTEPQTFQLGQSWGKTVILFLASAGQAGWRLGIVEEEADTGRIEILDNASYGKANWNIRVPAEKQLHIVAGRGCRPHLWGNLTVQGAESSDLEPGSVLLEGLLLEGQLTVLPGELQHLWVNHCTIVPGHGGLVVQAPATATDPTEAGEWSMIALALYYVHLIWKLLAINWNQHLAPSQMVSQMIQLGMQRVQYLVTDLWGCYGATCRDRPAELPGPYTSGDNEQLQISLESSICGGIQVEPAIAQLTIRNSIVDAGEKQPAQTAIAAFQTPLICEQATVLGSTIVLSIEATHSLFTDLLTAWRRQVGCLRFCYVPDESQTPHRYRCQPDLLLEHRLDRHPPRITALASQPQADGSTLLLAGTSNGLWRSDDGQSWQEVNQGLTNLQVNTLAIGDTSASLYVGTASGYLFVSQNQGRQWQPLFRLQSDVSLRGTPNTTHINQTISQGGQLLVATLGGRVFRSSDWSAPKQGLEQAIWNINALAVHPKAGWLFAGTAGTGVYYSEDMTNPEVKQPRWKKPPSVNLTNQTITTLAIATDGQIFVGTSGPLTKPGGLFYSTNNGDTWTQVPLPPHQRQITTIALHPKTGAIFAGTAQGGIVRSNDQGKTWETLTHLPHRNITALTITQQGVILAGTAGGLIWQSTDHGNYWIPSLTGLSQAEAKLRLLNQLQPSFTSIQYGDPGYGQLGLYCADEIRRGGEDGAELGCFNALKQTQRIANLQTSLEEYLRFGLEVSIFYIT